MESQWDFRRGYDMTQFFQPVNNMTEGTLNFLQLSHTGFVDPK